MGYWTYTDARRKPTILKNGDYASKDKIGYGCFAKIVCPDNTEIKEPYYEGYGMFDETDIFEAVVDWNKSYLEDIFKKLLTKNPKHFGYEFKDVAICYQNDDIDGLCKVLENIPSMTQTMKAEWKRTIGIAIACEDEDNKALPFPVKVTSTKHHKSYDELVPSCYCQ
jgi:hypothetical protein